MPNNHDKLARTPPVLIVNGSKRIIGTTLESVSSFESSYGSTSEYAQLSLLTGFRARFLIPAPRSLRFTVSFEAFLDFEKLKRVRLRQG